MYIPPEVVFSCTGHSTRAYHHQAQEQGCVKVPYDADFPMAYDSWSIGAPIIWTWLISIVYLLTP
jgi:hypothetical protein